MYIRCDFINWDYEGLGTKCWAIFYNVHSNFLLSIGNDSFLRIWYFDPKSLYLVVNFDIFLQNNEVITQGSCSFKRHQPRKSLYSDCYSRIFSIFCKIIVYLYEKKEGGDFQEKYELPEKFIFLQLVTNFADFGQNNSIFMQNSRAFKKYHLQEKFIF